MYNAPRHAAARKRHPLRERVAGLAIATSSTFAIGVALSPPVQAAGSVWDVVAACESSGRWYIHTGNGYFGGLQFSKATWRAFGGSHYSTHPHLVPRPFQILIARRVLGTQGPGAWPVCGRRAHLTRANGSAIGGPRTVSRSLTRSAVAVPGRLAVDGVIGPNTVGALQRWVGTARSGVLGATTVKALQRKVGASADGVIGPQTVRALQIRIGVRRDGAQHLSSATVMGLQRYLNRG